MSMNGHHNPAADRIINDSSIIRAFLKNADDPEKKLKLFDLTARNWMGRVQEGVVEKSQVVDRLQEIAEWSGLLEEHGQDFIQKVMSDATKPQATKPTNSSPLREEIVSDKPKALPRALLMTCAADITPKAVKWLWAGRLAMGKPTIIAGEPGKGKSTLANYVAATISTSGLWPCSEGRAPLGDVIILSAEDGIEDTIVPRLMAAGADLKRVHIITAVKQEDEKGNRSFNLKTDLDLLEQKLKELPGTLLFIVDPISSYMGKTDSHVNADVRSTLEPFAELADRRGVALLLITHLNKAGDNKALNRFIGSIAFVAAARTAFVVVEDEEDEARRLFLHVKNNLAPPPKGLAFRPGQREVAPGVIGSEVLWDADHVTQTADQALSAGSDSDRGALAEAEDFLLQELQSGRVESCLIFEQAKKAGITPRTLKRARAKLGVQSIREGFGAGGKFYLALPDPIEGQEIHRRPSKFDGPLCESWPPMAPATPGKGKI
jgi:putative DNA primase/helicase